MRRKNFSSPYAAQGGFTLIEMLLASVIFALVSYASFSMLTAVTDANTLSEETTKELYGMQRAFFWMERDFLQATKRQVRVDGEKATDKIFSGGELLMESEGGAVAFTHDGWRNPGMILPRSEIQSVSYRMFEGKLERLFFNYPDPVTGEIPKSQILLEEIEGLSFEFFSSDGWGNVWEKPGLPRAVKVEIETKALGKLERIFLLTDNVLAQGASKGLGKGP